MKKWQYAVVVVIFVVGVGAGALITWGLFKPAESIRIVGTSKPVSRIIYHPTSCEEYKSCFNTPISIDGKIINNLTFFAAATDGCKKTERTFRLSGRAKLNLNVIILDYEPVIRYENKIVIGHGAGVSYYRLLFNFKNFQFGLGAGIAVNQNEIILKPGLIFQF